MWRKQVDTCNFNSIRFIHDIIFIQCISYYLGTGRVRKIAKEDYDYMQQVWACRVLCLLD